MKKKRPSVFLSYRRKEKDLRDTFATLLGLLDIDVVFDVKSLTPGEDFSPEIRQMIDDTTATIVIWTRSSVGSKWVKLEAQRAMDRDKLIPIAIGRPNIAKEFRRLETRYFNKKFYGTENLADSLQNILDKINELAQAEFYYSPDQIEVHYRNSKLNGKTFDEADFVRIPPFRLFNRDRGPLRFLAVPKGKFLMGAKEAEFVSVRTKEAMEKKDLSDRPRFFAKIEEPFLMMQSPMTIEMAKELLKLFPNIPRLKDLEFDQFTEEDKHQPLLKLSWTDAQDICNFLTKETGFLHRLPSEVEWEYVARGGSESTFWFGDRADSRRAVYNHRYHYCNETLDSEGRITRRKGSSEPISTRPKPVDFDNKHRKHNETNFIDMVGNVYEWTADNVGYRYEYLRPMDARPQSPYRDQTAMRVIRGGCFSSKPEMLRSAARASRHQTDRDAPIALRLVRECFEFR